MQATQDSILNLVMVFQIILSEVSKDADMEGEGEGQGSGAPQSWMQKARGKGKVAALPGVKGQWLSVDHDGSAEDRDEGMENETPNIRGIVGWRNSAKSFLIWYKKASGERSQTQKGLTVKTSKKVGGTEVPLKRGEFLKEKRKAYQAAIQEWNEKDCSTKKRLTLPFRDVDLA